MSTQCKYCDRFAKHLGEARYSSLTKDIQTAANELQRVVQNNTPSKNLDEVLKSLHSLMSLVNKRESHIKAMAEAVGVEGTRATQMTLFTEEARATIPEMSEWTVDTSLGKLAPKLCALVGKSEFMHRLSKVKLNSVGLVSGYNLCRCLGYSGGEDHLIRVVRNSFMQARQILDTFDDHKGFPYEACRKFGEFYYNNLYLLSAKRLIFYKNKKDGFIWKSNGKPFVL